MPSRSPEGEEYAPAEDTMLVADNIQGLSGGTALDVGSGSGYLTRILAEGFDLAVGTDVNFGVLAHQTWRTENLVCCNGSDALACGFDLIVCNMPYLDTDGILDVATDGGLGGIEVPRRILDSASKSLKPNGRFLFVVSSLSDHVGLADYARKLGLECKTVARKKLFFEELMLVEAVWSCPQP